MMAARDAAAPRTPLPNPPPQGGRETGGPCNGVPSPLEGEGQDGGSARSAEHDSSAAPAADTRLPVTVVTGFLGSGKTTLINRLLKHPGMAETAVLVNEFGEIGLDHLLVEHIDESTVLIGAGCLCCTVREDMVAALDGLLARREADTVPPFRRVLVETTGLADPAPILHTLLADDRLNGRCRIDGIVATIDAVHGAAQLRDHEESRRQAAMADRLVLTKTDLAHDTTALAERLDAFNPSATRLTSPVAPDDLFGAGPGEDAERMARWLGAPGHHHHDESIASLSLEAEAPLRIDRVVGWIEDLLARRGTDLLRLKGILDLEGIAVPVVVHGVGHVFHPLERLRRWPEGPRRSRLVLIGRNLPAGEIARAFDRRCRTR